MTREREAQIDDCLDSQIPCSLACQEAGQHVRQPIKGLGNMKCSICGNPFRNHDHFRWCDKEPTAEKLTELEKELNELEEME